MSHICAAARHAGVISAHGGIFIIKFMWVNYRIIILGFKASIDMCFRIWKEKENI